MEEYTDAQWKSLWEVVRPSPCGFEGEVVAQWAGLDQRNQPEKADEMFPGVRQHLFAGCAECDQLSVEIRQMVAEEIRKEARPHRKV